MDRKNNIQFLEAEDPFCTRVENRIGPAQRLFDFFDGTLRPSLIAQENKKFILCLSGGIDSECMARAFLYMKIKFEVVFLRFKNELNMFDIITNIEFCENNKLTYKFIDLDIIDFLESGKFFTVAEKYECQSPQIAAHLWMLDKVDGIPFLSGNPMAPIWKDQHWFFVGLPGRLHSTYFKYFAKNDREGEPWFFLSTPEIASSFLHLNCMQPYLSKNMQHETGYSYSMKCKSYQESGFNVEPRGNKFTGFELVRQYYDTKNNTRFGTSFDKLFRKPLEEKFPFPQNYIQLVPVSYFPGEATA